MPSLSSHRPLHFPRHKSADIYDAIMTALFGLRRARFSMIASAVARSVRDGYAVARSCRPAFISTYNATYRFSPSHRCRRDSLIADGRCWRLYHARRCLIFTPIQRAGGGIIISALAVWLDVDIFARLPVSRILMMLAHTEAAAAVG